MHMYYIFHKVLSNIFHYPYWLDYVTLWLVGRLLCNVISLLKSNIIVNYSWLYFSNKNRYCRVCDIHCIIFTYSHNNSLSVFDISPKKTRLHLLVLSSLDIIIIFAGFITWWYTSRGTIFHPHNHHLNSMITATAGINFI